MPERKTDEGINLDFLTMQVDSASQTAEQMADLAKNLRWNVTQIYAAIERLKRSGGEPVQADGSDLTPDMLAERLLAIDEQQQPVSQSEREIRQHLEKEAEELYEKIADLQAEQQRLIKLALIDAETRRGLEADLTAAQTALREIAKRAELRKRSPTMGENPDDVITEIAEAARAALEALE